MQSLSVRVSVIRVCIDVVLATDVLFGPTGMLQSHLPVVSCAFIASVIALLVPDTVVLIFTHVDPLSVEYSTTTFDAGTNDNLLLRIFGNIARCIGGTAFEEFTK